MPSSCVHKFWSCQTKKCIRTCAKMRRFRSCAKYHSGLCSLFVHSAVSKLILLADREVPDQTARMLSAYVRRHIFAAQIITKTCLYNFDPLKLHLGFTGVYIIFLISAQKHRLWVLVRTASPRRF